MSFVEDLFRGLDVGFLDRLTVGSYEGVTYRVTSVSGDTDRAGMRCSGTEELESEELYPSIVLSNLPLDLRTLVGCLEWRDLRLEL